MLYSEYDPGSIADIAAGAVPAVIMIAVSVLSVAALWRIFKKAGEHGWAALIPVYNAYVLFRITWGSGAKFLLTLIPVYNIIVMIRTCSKLARAFGKGGGFAFGLLLLNPVFMLILAFGRSAYIGVPIKEKKGAVPQQNVYAGQQPRPPVYGQPQQMRPPVYGQPQQTRPPVYGQPQQMRPPVYGQPQQTRPPVYGQPQQTRPPVYGQPQQTRPSVYGQQPAPAGKKAGRPRKKGGKIALSLIAAALAVIFAVTAFWQPGFARPYLVRSVGVSGGGERPLTDKELFGPRPKKDPVRAPLSGSRAFRTAPVGGFTVSAEKNALDRDREFKVTQAGREELCRAAAVTVGFGAVPVAAFRVDAGMDGETRLPGTFRMELDLKECGVPEQLWNSLAVIRIEDDGSAAELGCRVKNGKLVSDSDRNSLMVTCVTSLTVLAVGTAAIEVERYLHDRGFEYGTEFNDLRLDCPNGVGYKLRIPSEKVKRTAEAERALGRMREIEEKYWAGLGGSADRPEQPVRSYTMLIDQIDMLCADKEWLELSKTVSDDEWKLANLFPEQMRCAYARLKDADAYLFGRREFKKPAHRVELYLVDNPLGGAALGHQINLALTRPFILLYTSVPDFTSDPGSLLITVTHEMFHVVQNRYCLSSTNEMVPFLEATAVMLEREAFEYYNRHGTVGQISENALTDRGFLQTLEYSMMMPGAWGLNLGETEETALIQGYTCSNFLEFMRDRYEIKEKFLEKLMEAWESSSEWYEAVAKVTSGDTDKLLDDFTVFCAQEAEDVDPGFYRTIKGAVKVPADTRVFRANIPGQCLSVRNRRIDYRSEGRKGARKYVIVFGDMSPQAGPFLGSLTGQILRIRTDGNEKTVDLRERGMADLGDIKRFAEIQEISAGYSPAETVRFTAQYDFSGRPEKTVPHYIITELSAPDKPVVYLPPERFELMGEKIEEEREVTIRLPDDPHARKGEYSYSVLFYNSAGKLVKREDLTFGAADLTVSEKELKKALGPHKLHLCTAALCQRADCPLGAFKPIYGPESERVRIFPLSEYPSLGELAGSYPDATLTFTKLEYSKLFVSFVQKLYEALLSFISKFAEIESAPAEVDPSQQPEEVGTVYDAPVTLKTLGPRGGIFEIGKGGEGHFVYNQKTGIMKFRGRPGSEGASSGELRCFFSEDRSTIYIRGEIKTKTQIGDAYFDLRASKKVEAD